MEGISDIRISGIDEKNPPLIRKQPYIDILFKLNHKAPKDWCDDFNQLGSKSKITAKITPETGLIIETWVRKLEEIEELLVILKQIVTTCTQDYITKIEARNKASDSSGAKPKDEGEQGRLNKIIAALNFDDES